MCIFSYGTCQEKAIVCGKIKSPRDFIAHIYEPVNGYSNLVFFDSSETNSVLINGKDSLYKSITVDKPVFITIYFTTDKDEFLTRNDILVFPGDSIHLDFDLNKPDESSVVYSGDNWMGNKLFNEINFVPYNKFIPVFDALDSLPGNKENFVSDINAIAGKIESRFDSLQRQRFITEDFKNYVSVCFRSLIFQQAISKLLKKDLSSLSLRRSERDSIIEALFKIQPATDKRLIGLYGDFLYLDTYFAYLSYKKLNLQTINDLSFEDRDYEVDGRNFRVPKEFASFTYIQNKKFEEDLWGLRILVYFGYPGKFDFSIARQYDSIFPNNKWSILIQSQYHRARLPSHIEYKLLSPVHFVDTTNAFTLDDVIQKLPAKPVFIDLWATWCYPCIAAFGYNSALDSFLSDHGVVKLYISVDAQNNYEIWKKAIDKYALGGYHILANSRLSENIQKMVYHHTGNEGMAIPRYLLYYKGRIVNDNLISPSELDLLKKQISRILKGLSLGKEKQE